MTDLLHLAGAPLPVVGRARVYVCGITPYDTTHLGHAATFVWTDVAVRVLRSTGVDVELCRNVTDVDDVLTAAAERAGDPYDRYAALQKFRFDQDMTALSVRTPTHEPRAHAHIGDVQSLAAALVAADRAYATEGSVYFRGEGVPEAAGLTRDEALRLSAEYGGRPDDAAKADPLDVAVWQSSSGDEPAWPSPWGPGRPGWHSECTAMALSILGAALDLHAGGRDLKFPHHAYEAAMAEAVTGVRPFARRWMHVGVVRIGGEKMAKSTGNLVLVDELVAKWPAAAVRLLLLSRRWADDWDYDPADLDAAADRLDRLFAASGRTTDDAAAMDAVGRALRNDLDVLTALDVAEESGGAAARTALATLGLT